MKVIRNSVGTLGSALNLGRQNNALLTTASSSPFIQFLNTLLLNSRPLPQVSHLFFWVKKSGQIFQVLDPPDGERIHCSNWVPPVPTLPSPFFPGADTGLLWAPSMGEKDPSFIMQSCCLTEMFRASLGCQSTWQEQEQDLLLQSWMAALVLVFGFCILSWMLN